MDDRFKNLNNGPSPIVKQMDVGTLQKDVAAFKGTDYHEVES